MNPGGRDNFFYRKGGAGPKRSKVYSSTDDLFRHSLLKKILNTQLDKSQMVTPHSQHHCRVLRIIWINQRFDFDEDVYLTSLPMAYQCLGLLCKLS